VEDFAHRYAELFEKYRGNYEQLQDADYERYEEIRYFL